MALTVEEKEKLSQIEGRITAFLDAQLESARADRWRITRYVTGGVLVLLVPIVLAAVAVTRDTSDVAKDVAVLTRQVNNELVPAVRWARSQAHENYMALREGRLPDFYELDKGGD